MYNNPNGKDLRQIFKGGLYKRRKSLIIKNKNNKLQTFDN